MAHLVHTVVENYNDLLNSQNDPLVNSLWLMSSPWPTVALIAIYLYFVLSLGPTLMKTREPFTLKWVLIVYNLYQVSFSLWLCSHVFDSKTAAGVLFNHNCKSPNPELRKTLVKMSWWYYFSKVVELLDTVFFVLRKKQNQVSFLHVYHHSAMVLCSWGYLKLGAGAQGIVIGFLNSFVHIVMYSYYLIAALGPQFHKYLWWKKYMTRIQLTQFILMLGYLAYIMSLDCKQFSTGLTCFFVVNVVIYLYLFSNFYRKTYKASNRRKECAKIN